MISQDLHVVVGVSVGDGNEIPVWLTDGGGGALDESGSGRWHHPVRQL